jgi:hypothetical protein
VSNPALFIRTSLGGQIVTLRVTEDFEWRRDTIDNPAWLDVDRNPRLRISCLLWCMLDGKYKGLETIRDVWKAYKDAPNREEVDRAVLETWQLANPERGSKNAAGSTESPSAPSS